MRTRIFMLAVFLSLVCVLAPAFGLPGNPEDYQFDAKAWEEGKRFIEEDARNIINLLPPRMLDSGLYADHGIVGGLVVGMGLSLDSGPGLLLKFALDTFVGVCPPLGKIDAVIKAAAMVARERYAEAGKCLFDAFALKNWKDIKAGVKVLSSLIKFSQALQEGNYAEAVFALLGVFPQVEGTIKNQLTKEAAIYRDCRSLKEAFIRIGNSEEVDKILSGQMLGGIKGALKAIARALDDENNQNRPSGSPTPHTAPPMVDGINGGLTEASEGNPGQDDDFSASPPASNGEPDVDVSPGNKNTIDSDEDPSSGPSPDPEDLSIDGGRD